MATSVGKTIVANFLLALMLKEMLVQKNLGELLEHKVIFQNLLTYSL